MKWTDMVVLVVLICFCGFVIQQCGVGLNESQKQNNEFLLKKLEFEQKK